MIIAYCNNFDGFNNNKILNKELAAKYPGMMWIPLLAEMLSLVGDTLVTGDIAISLIQSNTCDPREVFVIQEMTARDGKKLINMGARPFLLTSLESPLIAWHFYDTVNKIAPIFENRILFSGLFNSFITNSGNNYNMTYPNFDIDAMVLSKEWSERKFMVLVAANKYAIEPFRLPDLKNIKSYIFWLAVRIIGKLSRTRKDCLKKQLNLKRVELIEYFGKDNLLELFGTRWELTNVLPRRIESRVRPILNKLNPRVCKDKIKEISNYKFAVCFENVRYQGYITEKIIDCFAAGVIPIYCGAPDVDEYIPRGSYINFDDFEDLDKLKKYLMTISDTDANEIISCGQAFIKSEKGLMYSNKGFAEFVYKLTRNTIEVERCQQ